MRKKTLGIPLLGSIDFCFFPLNGRILSMLFFSVFKNTVIFQIRNIHRYAYVLFTLETTQTTLTPLLKDI